MGKRLAESGYSVLVVNPFYRTKKAPTAPEHADFSDPETRKLLMERGKAESLGLNAKGGLMERAERIVALCIALAFSVVMLPVLFVMLGLTLITAVQRFVMVWRRAAAPPRLHRDRPRRWELRLEARRAARRGGGAADGRRTWRRQVRTRP